MSTHYILGIDAGTSVIKSALFDLQGHEVAQSAVETPVAYPQEGWAELDMATVWQGVVDCVHQVGDKAHNTVDGFAANQVRAVGITGQGDGTWLADTDHRPIRPAIIWLDGRTADLVRGWQDDGVSDQFFQITGTVLNTSNQAAHLRWLADNEPETLAQANVALRAKDWIFLNMTGVVSTDESDASYTFFDLKQRAYADEIWDLFGIPQCRALAPPARPAYENRAELLPHIAETLGLSAGTPVVAGPFDAVAMTVGIGALTPGSASTTLGTAGLHQITLDQPSSDPVNVGYTMCHAPANRWVRLLPTMSCTPNLQWFVDQFFQHEIADAQANQQDSWAALEALAAAVPVGSKGIMYHPYIDPAGERVPFVRPEVRAQFTGLDIHHTRADMLRAVYEGVMLSALDCFAYLPTTLDSLKLAGGGARSDLWAQMFADGLGCPVAVMAGDEFGAKGAAINAGVATGVYASFDAAAAQTVRPSRQYTPNLAHTAHYRELAQLYQQTYQAMFPVWEARAKGLSR